MRAFVIAVIVLCASSASAGPKDKVIAEAQKRFARGNALYEKGDYEGALLSYKAAFELVPSPDILFNLGLAQEKTLDYAGCVQSFEHYLAIDGKDVDGAKARAAGCRAHVRMPVTITSVPPGVAISHVAEATPTFLGRTPTTLELPLGEYDLLLDLEGYMVQGTHIDVTLGKSHNYDFQLTKLSKLRIAANAEGAMVAIDDNAPEPAPIERLVTAGSYEIRVTAPGHLDVVRTAFVDAGNDASLSIELPPVPTTQSLRLRSIAGSVILIDGAPATEEVQLGAGLHVVEAVAPGRVPYRGQVVLPAGEVLAATITLPPKRTALQRALLWGGAGLAGVFAIGGGIYGGLALDAEAEYRDMPSVATRDDGVAFRFAADLLLGSAIVVGAATAIYWYVTRPDAATLEVQR